MITDEWLAGFFDGEGSASIYILKYNANGKKQISLRPRLFFTQADKQILLDIQTYLGLEGQNINNNSYNSINLVYNLEIKGVTNVEKCARLLIKHSILKHKQLRILIEFCELSKEKSKHKQWSKKDFVRALDMLEDVTKTNKRGYLRSQATWDLIARFREELSKLKDNEPANLVYNTVLLNP